jgi:hypothetical protein
LLGILPIIQLAFGLVNGILVNKDVISQNTGSLITQLSNLGSSLLGVIIANKGQTAVGIPDTMAALGTLSGVIAVLKQNTNLSPDFLAYLNQASDSVNASLAGYVTAGRGFDLSLYAPVANV